MSLVQSLLINTLALWVMFVDEERKAMSAVERVYGYTGGCGLIQGLATGYFVWDLIVSTRHLKTFGPGIWAHALAALTVFSFGFVSPGCALKAESRRPPMSNGTFYQRPFLNFYGPTFILYELSSPFLNVHWFCDKLNRTGSRLQWYNGMILLSSFFACRLLWGTYQSIRVYQDVWAALHIRTVGSGDRDLSTMLRNQTHTSAPVFVPRDGQLCLGEASCVAAQAEVVKFVHKGTKAIPIWLAGVYLSSNIVLNSLNFYWFMKMIETVKKRFEGNNEPDEKDHADAKVRERRSSSVVLDGAAGLEKAMSPDPELEENIARSTARHEADEVKRRL